TMFEIRKLILVAICLSSFGCTTITEILSLNTDRTVRRSESATNLKRKITPSVPTAEPAADKALVYIIRGATDRPALAYIIRVDAQPIGQIEPTQSYLSIDLNPGEHQIGCETMAGAGIQRTQTGLNAQSGRDLLLRSSA
ncbi:MAG: hypothetical protein ABIH23_26325, partial [bacterium]